MSNSTSAVNITARVKQISVYEGDSSVNVTLSFDKTFEGIVLKDNDYIKADTNRISFNRSALTAQLCEADSDLAQYRAISGSWNQKQFGLLLFGAVITMKREFKAAGEVVNESALEHDCFITVVDDVKLSERAKNQLNKAIDNVL